MDPWNLKGVLCVRADAIVGPDALQQEAFWHGREESRGFVLQTPEQALAFEAAARSCYRMDQAAADLPALCDLLKTLAQNWPKAHVILVCGHDEPSGSIRHQARLEVEEAQILLHIVRIVPQMGTMDCAHWFFFAALPAALWQAHPEVQIRYTQEFSG